MPRGPVRQALAEPPPPSTTGPSPTSATSAQTMEGASAFTAFSGWGLARHRRPCRARRLARRTAADARRLAHGLARARGGVRGGGAAVSTWWKARRTEESPLGGPGRRFALSLAPPLVAGALLSLVLVGQGLGPPAGRLAGPLRRRPRHRRRVLRPRGARHGRRVHGAGRAGPARSRRVGRRAPGGRLRRPPPGPRPHHRSAPRWLRAQPRASGRSGASRGRPPLRGGGAAARADAEPRDARQPRPPPAAPRDRERARRRRVAHLQRAQGADGHHRRQPVGPRAQARGRPVHHVHQELRGPAAEDGVPDHRRAAGASSRATWTTWRPSSARLATP